MREDALLPAVKALIGEIAGERTCDLACGQGRVARYLADLGAHVVGIDISTKVLEIARRHEATEPRGIEYLQSDAKNLDGEALGAFDDVACFILERLSETLTIVASPDSPSLIGMSRPAWAEVPAVLVAKCRKRGPGH